MALAQFRNCIQMVTGCDLKKYMCGIHVCFYAECNVQASSADDLCIQALLHSYTSTIIL